MAVGLDIGTANFVSARQTDNAQIQTKSIRDVFIDIEADGQIKQMLKLSGMSFIEIPEEERIYVIGDPALSLANVFKREVRRPLSKGVLSPGEGESAEKIIKLLLNEILGKAQVQNELCFFSVPAQPLDKSVDVFYHEKMFEKILKSLNYLPQKLNEACAIVFSDAAKEQFTAIGISFGAGLVNVALVYRTVIGMEYSVAGSGDFIDSSSALATGRTASYIMALKEKGVNLIRPDEGDPRTVREREAISIYYKSLIMRVLESFKSEFIRKNPSMDLSQGIPIIIGGGTALAGNFLELFKESFESIRSRFPVPVTEIRLVPNPLACVSTGLLVAALNSQG
jgi:hypothetical protein